MKNFLLFIVIVLGVCLVIVLFSSKGVEGDFKSENTAQFSVGRDLVWQVMNDFNYYRENKRGLTKVIEKESLGDTVVSWREEYKFGVTKDYELITKRTPEFLEYEIKNNFTGMKTQLTFSLREEGYTTYLVVSELSSLENPFFRGLKFLAGQDAFVNSEIKRIRVAVQNYLINK